VPRLYEAHAIYNVQAFPSRPRLFPIFLQFSSLSDDVQHLAPQSAAAASMPQR
jgi:hypothetical protein